MAFPQTLTGFAEGETSKASDKYVGGKSTMGVGNYSGPCTPPGPPHHYTFVLIATDFETGDLPAGLTRDECHREVRPAAGARQRFDRLDRPVRESVARLNAAV